MSLRLPSLRAALAVLILAAWAGSLTWLGLRQLESSGEFGASRRAPGQLAPGTAWFALVTGGVQVGYASISLDTISPGYRILENIVAPVRTPSGLATLRRRTEVEVSQVLGFASATASLAQPDRRLDWSLRQVSTSTVVGTFRWNSIRHVSSDDLPAMSLPWVALPLRLALGGSLEQHRPRYWSLTAGDPPASRTLLILPGEDSLFVYSDSSAPDAVTGQWMPAHYDSVRATAAITIGPQGPTRLWVDAGGSVLRLEPVFGFRWDRIDADLAQATGRRSLPERSDSVARVLPVVGALISAAGPPDTSTRTRRFLARSRDGRALDPQLMAWLAGGRQRVVGDTIIVEASGTAVGPDTSSDDGNDLLTDPEDAILRNLPEERGWQANGRGGVTVMVQALRRMVRTDSLWSAPATASGTWRAGRGRPDGVARLLAALVRAAGGRARYVVGVFPSGDTLLTHAWVEVRDAERGSWYAVDPARGAPVASTGLIRLAWSGSSYPEDLLMSLANVRFVPIAEVAQR